MRTLVDRIVVDRIVSDDGRALPLTTIARRLGISGSVVHRYIARGLNPFAADRLALRAGYHPSDVWGEKWWSPGIAESKRSHPSQHRTPTGKR